MGMIENLGNICSFIVLVCSGAFDMRGLMSINGAQMIHSEKTDKWTSAYHFWQNI